MSDDNVTLFFLLGETKNDVLLQRNVKMESQEYNDIIQERFTDSYANLSVKSVNMLKLPTVYCPNSYDYLMKVDDDMFVNIEKIAEMLLKLGTSSDLLMGRARESLFPIRDKTSKWYMPYTWYPFAEYPTFLCGPGYILSSDVVQKLYSCAMSTPMLHMEDVYITGICAKKINVKPKHSELFSCNALKGSICCHRHFYTLHYFTASDIRNSYRLLEDNCSRHDRDSVWKPFSAAYCRLSDLLSSKP